MACELILTVTHNDCKYIRKHLKLDCTKNLNITLHLVAGKVCISEYQDRGFDRESCEISAMSVIISAWRRDLDSYKLMFNSNIEYNKTKNQTHE